MVPEGCPPGTSLGITRSFPRLYPIMGLVTVALLTLAPLALRPVRLACLIHAANVHSEPGSNPSKKVEPIGPPRRGPAVRSSTPQRVEESDWSHRDGVELEPAGIPPGPRAVRLAAGWCDHPRRGAAPTRTTAASTTRHHAGFPQGFLSQDTTAIDRIVKEPAAPMLPAGATSPKGCHAGR